MLQPLMSMRTVRKSAAAIAPETSASAASRSGGGGPGGAPHAALPRRELSGRPGTAASAAGT